MNFPASKYPVGAHLFLLTISDHQQTHECPLCHGDRKVAVVGSDLRALCPCCGGRGKLATPTKYRRFSIGEVHIGVVVTRAVHDSQAKDGVAFEVTYLDNPNPSSMAHVYHASELFVSEADALASAIERGLGPADRVYR